MMDNIYITKSSMPSFEEYTETIKPLWESHFLTNMGSYHKSLEKELADYLAVPEISLLVNGHMALEMTIQSYGFPPGSEIITTPFTFISTTHAIVRNGLCPVFCDVKDTDGTIDEEQIEKFITPRTVAILPVHVYGNVCAHKKIEKIAYKYGLKVIYDACHAFGEKVDGMGIGNLGDASIFSFHATKVFNTIEGGAVVCKDHDLYEKLYNLKNFGIRGEDIVVSVGANAKMNEFVAAMGLCNLKHIDFSIEKRKAVYKEYADLIEKLEGIHLLSDKEQVVISNYGYVPAIIEDTFPISRDELYHVFTINKIFVRKYFYPLTADQACFKNRYKDCDIPIARSLSKRILCLPIYEDMTDAEIKRIKEVLISAEQ